MWAIIVLSLIFATVATVAILKKKRMKATGTFFKFGFTIEASDDEEGED